MTIPDWFMWLLLWIVLAVVLSVGWWFFRHEVRDREDLLHGGEGWDER